jgi:hypothetical protein
MAASIQDALLLRAQQDAANRENNGLAITAGALAGTAAGLSLGGRIHRGGQLANKLKDRLAAAEGLTRTAGMRTKEALTPGGRMAGGLVGLLAGGSLGAAAQSAFIGQSDAGKYLAKIQMGDPMSPEEMGELEQILTGTYNNIIG